MKKEKPEKVIDIVKWEIRLFNHGKKVELIAIDKNGKEYSPRYYAEFGREYEPLSIQEL